MKNLKNLILLFVLLISSTFNLFGQTPDPADDNNIYYQITINGPSAVLSSGLSESAPIQSTNATTGAVNITASGGTPPYRYFLYKSGTSAHVATGSIASNNGSQEITGLGHGTYYVDIYDANYSGSLTNPTYSASNCNNKRSTTVLLANPNPLFINASIRTVIDCKGEKGAINVDVKGGVQPTVNSGNYRVELLLGGVLQATKFASFNATTNQRVFFDNLSAGNYSVRVTDRFINNTDTQSLSEPSAFVTFQKITNSEVDATCNGVSNGKVTVKAGGGTPPYSVFLDGSSSAYATFSTTSNFQITGLGAKSYTLKVKDSNGCTPVGDPTYTFTIGEPDELQAINPIATTTVSQGTSSGGTIQVEVIGGTEAYTYELKQGSTTYTNFTIESLPGNREKVKFLNLSKGTYSFKVTDSKGCEDTITSIQVKNPAILEIPFTSANATCFGTDGNINISASGGFTNNYRYEWFKKSGATFNKLNSLTGNSENISAGIYKITVSVLSTSNSVLESKDTPEITITQPTQITLDSSTAITHLGCKGNGSGAITLGNVTGGTPLSGNNYNYSWTNSSWSTNRTTRNLTGLAAGVYEVTISDAVAGCSITRSFTVEEPSSELTVSLRGAVTNPSINSANLGGVAPDGKIEVNVSGGWGDYTYKWTNGSGTVVSTDKDLLNVGAGIYSLEVTDKDGRGNTCVDTSIMETLTEPAELKITINTRTGGELFCNGNSDGSLEVSVTGGTGNYNYAWYKKNGASRDFISGQSGTINDSTLATITGLSAGTYGVRINMTNANGTVINYSNPDFNLTEPTKLELNRANVQVNTIDCFGESGSVTIAATGGTQNYIYFLSKNSVLTNPSGTAFTGTSTTVSGLSEGTYSIEIRDQNGCRIRKSDNSLDTIDFTLTEPDELQIISGSTVATDASGFNIADGTIMLAVNGGTPSYFYRISRGGAAYSSWTTFNSSTVITGLAADNYSVQIKDANDCLLKESGSTKTLDFTINQPDELLVSFNTNPVTTRCNGETTVLNPTISGGFLSTPTTDYTYAWSLANDPTNTVIHTERSLIRGKGRYKLVVTDSNGNFNSATVEVVDNPLLEIQYTASDVSNVSCFGGNDGSINVSVTGGTGSYDYKWSNNATTQDLNNLTAGSYTLTVEDTNGCKADVTIVITEPATSVAIDTSSENIVNVTGFGKSDGSITVLGLADSGTPFVDVSGTKYYQYSLANKVTGVVVGTTSTVTGLAGSVSGIVYTMTVTDANGCSVSKDYTITQPEALVVSVVVSSEIACNGEQGTLSSTVTGGFLNPSSNYTYAWSLASDATNTVIGTNSTLTAVAGSYKLVVTDSNGNTAEFTATLTENPLLEIQYTASDVSNVSCFGGNDGSINVSVTGGTGSYDYKWSNNATTEDLNNLTAGSYKLTVEDTNGCKADVTIVITEPATSVAIDTSSENIVNVTGFGKSDGSITVLGLADSGTPFVDVSGTKYYQYSLANKVTGVIVGTTSTVTGLAGSVSGIVYTMTVTDANGCSVSKDYTITQPEALVVSVIVSSEIACNGEQGTLSSTVTGGFLNPSSNYTYAWSLASDATNTVIGTNSTLTAVAGSYKLVVTDSNGNTAEFTATLTENPVLAISYSASDVSNVSCFGGNDGSINVSVTGGTGSYDYKWSNNATTEDLNNLTAGSYTLTVEDTNGCKADVTIVITEPATSVAIDTSSENIVNVTGFGKSDGSITVLGLADSGTPFVDVSGTKYYQYSLANKVTGVVVGTTSTVTGLAGSVSGIVYTMTVTDANGCSVSKDYTITQPEALVVSIVVSSEIACNGEQGTLSSTVTGGFLNPSSNYTYAWSLASDATNTVIGTNSTLTAVAGSYKLVVTDSNGNTAEFTATLTENPVLAISYSASDVSNVTCYNGNDGSINITVTGGTGAGTYTYEWSNGATTEDINTLVAGDYEIRVTDNNGCRTSQTITITQPDTYEIVVDKFVRPTGFGVSNGEISLIVNGGTDPKTYSWKNESGTEFSTSLNISGLAAGKYFFTSTDANNCVLTAEYNLDQPDPLLISIKEIGAIQCNGDSSGMLELETSGGFGGNVYSWFNATTNTQIGGNSTSISNLLAGSYYVRVVDAGGNETTSTTYTITQPTLLQVSSSKTDLSCFESSNGEISLTATGATGPYFYRSRKDGGAYSSWIQFNGNTTISGLTIGTYDVQIKDSNDCLLKDSSGFTQTLNFVLTQPNILAVTEVITNVTGFGLSNGDVNITVTGGTLPYSFIWKNASGTVIANTEDVSNLPAGSYSVDIEDAQGCTISDSYTITQPDLLVISIREIGAIQCNGDTSGTLELETTGGIGGNVFTWFDASSNTQIGSNSSTITNLSAGSYYVRVVDANGNQATSSTYTITEPTLLQVSSSKTDLSCFESANGEISLTATGATGPYFYRYRKDGGAYGAWNQFAGSTTLSGLSIGNYDVQVRDSNNCVLQESGSDKIISYTLTQPDILAVTEIITNVTGFGLSNGDLNITVTGGTLPYKFTWKDASGTVIANTEDVSNLPAGSYSIDIEDAQGCTISDSYTITQPDLLVISIREIGAIQCNGDTSGTLELETTGGIGGNVFTWFDASSNTQIGSNSTTITNLSAGSYYVRVVDANGNQATSSTYTITEPSLLQISSSKTDLSCFESANGEISLTATGATGPYFYRYRKDGGAYGAWNQFAGSTTLSGLSIGNYDVQVRDSNNCVLQESGSDKIISYTLTQPDILAVTEVITNVTGFGLSNGDVNITVTGGTLPYNFTWKDASGTVIANTEDISNLIAGSYSLELIDAQGCIVNRTYTITQPDALQVQVTQQSIVLCKDDNTANISSVVTGGVLPYSYQWFAQGNTNILDTSSSLSGIGVGTYYVIVTDAQNNVTQSSNVTVTEPEVLAVTLDAQSAGCGTDNDWTITANPTGGTPPYSYFWNSGEKTQTIQNKSLGTYFVYITDANGCQITENIVLENNSPLNVQETITDIICFNECTGEIDLTIEGGVAPYSIVWSSGQTTENISGLCSGEYTVQITDLAGCSIVKTYSLQNPAEITFELIPNDVTLCVGESIEYDVTMNGVVDYSWTSTNGFTSNDSVVELSEEGEYTLTITTTEGCTVSKSVTITKSDAVVDAQFIVSSQAFVGEEIAIINLSNPISSEVEWEIPSNVEVIQKEKEGLILKFNAPGDYVLSLKSIEGNCTKKATKTITVLKERFLTDVGDAATPFIKEFKVYANPNQGQFKVDVELEKEAEISLRLFGLGANNVVVDKTLNGQKEYTVDYDMNTSAGIYILLLETPKAKRIRKVIIE
ncbi:SprB repeat-containing protein [Tenacibaculum sp. 190524A05c]|uniref:SprB repeat-containing protein n=1 Tax=Tenacibaculum platacis TaxID=3137852 RepID=UPI0032B2D637